MKFGVQKELSTKKTQPLLHFKKLISVVKKDIGIPKRKTPEFSGS